MTKKYEQRKMAHQIKVATEHNGYSLEVDGSGYFYFSVAELVEGFFTHVGIGIADYCDEQTMRDLITACATYPNEGDAIKAVSKLQAEIEALHQSHGNDLETIRDLKARNAKIAEELASVKLKLNRYLDKPVKPKKPNVSTKVHPTLSDADEKPKALRIIRKPHIKVKPSEAVDKELEAKLKAKGVLK